MRRILAARYRPSPDSAGPSWLTVLGHTKDSLWSLDLFRCESAVLRLHAASLRRIAVKLLLVFGSVAHTSIEAAEQALPTSRARAGGRVMSPDGAD